jgi:hypothetical protein
MCFSKLMVSFQGAVKEFSAAGGLTEKTMRKLPGELAESLRRSVGVPSGTFQEQCEIVSSHDPHPY